MNFKLRKYSTATDQDLLQAEKSYQTSFPPEYLEFVRQFDGAVPEDNQFNGNVRISVDCFIPIRNVPSFADKIEGFPRNEIPIAEDPQGSFLKKFKNLKQSDLK
ncbi:SMI1/KNR4 family protein [Coraliomargarita sp. SDUM461003]|uniref:SMI1/KNR4 family protein n=1 Tax=Thalassobacterium maritimum TaxID=3041265 RepID=A0ABU1ANY8_9BACT|nr:SMI1/KNR4 family protein [Coraliomargarita sp. SDUM461003]MDQ8205890.1 SMI1/KNR4 family protein [Coraliomargarita sp. SDUM461003]